jgi:nucleotide-binding universal stress UspA family protein
MGLKADKVSTQICKKAISRAGAIAGRAKQEDFGTIVMGRIGHSHVRDFFIGRVTDEVIHMATEGRLDGVGYKVEKSVAS